MPIKLSTSLCLAALLAAGTASQASAEISATTLPASFLVVHGIPGRNVSPTADPALPVDVLVGGKICLLKGFTFGSIAGPFDVPAGTYSVAISLANPLSPCSNAPVISGNISLTAGAFGAIVAAISTAGAPSGELYPIDVSAVGAGKQRFVTIHAADAPAVGVTAVASSPSGFETLRFPLDPGKVNESVAFDRPEFDISASAPGAFINLAHVTPSDQSVIVTFAVGSAKTNSVVLLTKLLPSVF
jgi:hypothetical protein